MSYAKELNDFRTVTILPILAWRRSCVKKLVNVIVDLLLPFIHKTRQVKSE